MSTSTRIPEQSALPQFSLFEIGDEPDELTIRRDFAPKRPPRAAVEVTDADATWKWQARPADAQGKFAGVALPLLDDEHAIEFDPSEVEVTREMVSPFAMREVAKPLELRRRPRPLAPKRAVRREPRAALIALCAVLAVALVGVIALIARRPHAAATIRPPGAAIVQPRELELPPIPAPTPKGAKGAVGGSP